VHSVNSKKVALFLGALHGGGAQRVMINLASGFIERGVQVDLVLANADGPYLKNVPSDVRIINLQATRVLYSIPRLISYLKTEQPTVMLSTVAHANLAALIARRFSGASTDLFVRVENTISRSTADETGLKSYLLRFLIRHLFSWADGIITPSKGVADDLVKNLNLPHDLMHVIYNPVVRPEIYEKAKLPITHPWFAVDEPPVIIGVGRLTKQKDFATLIRAFSIVRKKYAARLLILGEGEERQSLNQLINDLEFNNDVDLHGFEENPYAFMAKSSVYVLSSLWEGLPNTLIEAMAVGTPVVSTNCESGPKEILANGKYGWIAPMGDSESIANGILNILTTKNYPKPDKEAMKDFEIKAIVEKYLKILLYTEHEYHS